MQLNKSNAERLITTLMGDDIEARKKYLSEYVDFNKVDNFMDMAD